MIGILKALAPSQYLPSLTTQTEQTPDTDQSSTTSNPIKICGNQDRYILNKYHPPFENVNENNKYHMVDDTIYGLIN